MTLQQLEYVIAVDKYGNFTKAAKFCKITQSTLSLMIKKLEEELEIILFDRTTNPILTTDLGKIVIQEALNIVTQCYNLKNNIKNYEHVFKGKFKLGIIPTIANCLLPLIVKKVFLQFPNLEIEIKEHTTDTLKKMLKDGEIDVAIVSTPLGSDVIFEEEILYYECLYVYGNFDTSKKFILPDELIKTKIWLLEEGNCLREQFINLCRLKEKTIQNNRLIFEANTVETILNMVDKFGGMTLLPELYVKNLSKERQKKINFFQIPIPVREVSLLYYRPFAKQIIIDKLSNLIRLEIEPLLQSKNYKNKDLTIVNA